MRHSGSINVSNYRSEDSFLKLQRHKDAKGVKKDLLCVSVRWRPGISGGALSFVMRADTFLGIFTGLLLLGRSIVAANEPESWRGNRIGVDHTVPLPWTPMKVSGLRISCWGRTTDLGGRALPSQIVTQKAPLLAQPMRIQVGFEEGEWRSADTGKCTVIASYPDSVVLEGKMTAPGIPIRTRLEMEFDGFTWLTLTLGPAVDRPIKRLALDIPLRESVAKYYAKDFSGYAPTLLLDMWGNVEKNRRMKVQNLLQLTNEEVGIALFAEGRAGWLLERRDRQMELIKEKGHVIVRYNLVDLFTPQPFEKERTISCGWNALPVKPMPKDFRRYMVVTGFGGVPQKERPYYDTGMTPVFIRWNGHFPESKVQESLAKGEMDYSTNCNDITVPVPVDPEFTRAALRKYHAAGRCYVVPYTVGNEHSLTDPVFYRHIREWSARPVTHTPEEVAKLKETEGWHTVNICGWSDSFADYKVWFMTQALRNIGWDGFYYDNQGFNPCENPDHREHQFTDFLGKRIPVIPIRKYRELFKRIYRELKRVKPHSMIVGHGCNPAYPFVDIYIGGEPLLKLAGETDYYTAFMSPEHCKNPFFNGHPIGVPYLWLPEYRGKFYIGSDSFKATRAMLSLLWLTDSCYWHAWSNFGVLLADANVRGDFRIWDAEWLPFWKQDVVHADQEGIHVAVYRKPDSALLIVSNPTPTARASVTLTVNADTLFPRTPLTHIEAADAEYAQYVKLGFKPDELKTHQQMQDTPLLLSPSSGGRGRVEVRLSVAAEDLRILRLQKRRAS